MKKEVHTRTVLGQDGQEHTFVTEESTVQQDDTEPPEQLRDSMQQIIDEFMDNGQKAEAAKPLEHDV